MRHRTWQFSVLFGGWLPFGLYQLGEHFSRGGSSGFAMEFCFWAGIVVFLAYLIGGILLRLTGRLELTYSEAERTSGLHHEADRQSGGHKS